MVASPDTTAAVSRARPPRTARAQVRRSRRVAIARGLLGCGLAATLAALGGKCDSRLGGRLVRRELIRSRTTTSSVDHFGGHHQHHRNFQPERLNRLALDEKFQPGELV